MVTPSEIEAFLAICRWRSISRAAEALFICQSSLSARLKKLETEEETAAREEEQKQAALPELCLAILIPDDRPDLKEDVIDILAAYPGEMPVRIKAQGKTFQVSVTVRDCPALRNELSGLLPETNVKIFQPKGR